MLLGRLSPLRQHLGEAEPSLEEMLFLLLHPRLLLTCSLGDSLWPQVANGGVTATQTKGDRVRVMGSDVEGGPGRDSRAE